MALSTWTRARFGLVLALLAALLCTLAAPAGAVTRKQATSKALNALGARKGTAPVIVFALRSASPGGTKVTQRGTRRLVIKVGGERAFLFYEDRGPFRAYPHPGRIALVGAKSGKLRVSKAFSRAPLVGGKLPAFLGSAAGYRSAQYRVFARLGTLAQPAAPLSPTVPAAPASPGGGDGTAASGPNKTPKADAQSVVAKQNSPKHITLTASDDNGDFLIFAVTEPPDHGTLSGAAPNLVYTPDPGYLGKDKFGFKAYDDTSQSNTAHVTIDVRPVGSPPTTATSTGCTAYNARAAAVAVDGLITVADPDDTTLDSARVQITTNFQDGDDLVFTDQNGIIGSYDDTTGVLTLTGDASVANYQAALRSVRYRNLSTGSPATPKTVSFTVNDAGSDSAPATKQVCITPGGPNRRPVGETTTEGALNYTENDGPIAVDPNFIAVDPDSPTLSGATVKFTSSQGSQDDETGTGGPGGTIFNFFPGEDRLAFTDQNGITGSYNLLTGVLTLSGPASVADYQTALQSVTYENTSENPVPDVRTVRFQLTDSSGATSIPSTRDVYVTPVNDAPTVTPSDGSTSYTEGDPATNVDSTVVVGDVDNTELTGGQVRISSGFQPGDALIFADQNNISGAYDTGTGILTLTGTASVADYQTAVQSIKFHGTSDNPPATKTVEFVVNDGALDSGSATKDIAITPVNDAPVLSATAGSASYAENAAPVAIDPGITASDPDSSSFTGATVQISGNLSSSEDRLRFTDQNGITGSYDEPTGTLTLGGSASVAEYQAALQSVAYENTSDNPSTATRTVTFQVDDGGAANNLSAPVTRDVTVTASNDAPVVAASAGSSTYTTGDTTGVAVDAALTATDADDSSLESATVTISDFQPGDQLGFVDQSTISGGYDSLTGILTLTGPASVEDFQAALESVTFHTTAASPGTSRTVDFVVNDGDADSNTTTKTIDIVTPPPNDAPIVTTSDGVTPYAAGDPAAVVDSGVTVTDANDTNIESARVEITGGFEGGDTLVLEEAAVPPSVNLGSDPDNGILTLTGTATVAEYEAALQAVKIQTSSGATQGSRTVSFTVNDGDVDSNTATKTVSVGPPTP
jgi:trimeric autotransporter adhesin